MHRILAGAIIIICIANFAWAEDITISIKSPKDGDKVLNRPLVTGTVSDPNAAVWVIVHPLEVSDYWVQPAVSVRSNGSWKVMIYIGRPGSTDINKTFEIKAVVNPHSTLREGQVLSNWPEAKTTSELIEVIRK